MCNAPVTMSSPPTGDCEQLNALHATTVCPEADVQQQVGKVMTPPSLNLVWRTQRRAGAGHMLAATAVPIKLAGQVLRLGSPLQLQSRQKQRQQRIPFRGPAVLPMQ